MGFAGACDGHLNRFPVGVFHFFLEQDQTCNDVGPVRFDNQWDFTLKSVKEAEEKMPGIYISNFQKPLFRRSVDRTQQQPSQ